MATKHRVTVTLDPRFEEALRALMYEKNIHSYNKAINTAIEAWVAPDQKGDDIAAEHVL